MLIGIVSALKEEIISLTHDLMLKAVEAIGNRNYYIGTLYGIDTVMVCTNCGKVSAATSVTILIERYQVDLVIFTGVAGGADANLGTGDIVVGNGTIQHDFDVSGLTNFPKYDNTLLGKSMFGIKEQYVDLLKASIDTYLKEIFIQDIDSTTREKYNLTVPKVVTGIIASGDQFIADSGKIEELNQGIVNLKCVDMESASAAQICYEYNIDFMVFRTISDLADQNADISFDQFLNDVATIYSKGILKILLKNLQL